MILLDTNTIIHCLKGRDPALTRFRDSNPAEVAVPSLVAYELEYGTLRITSAGRRRTLSLMLDNLADVPFDRDAAREAARVRVDLENRGIVIQPLDLLIAGITLSRGATLATNNTKEYSRIKALRLEDWTAILPGQKAQIR